MFLECPNFANTQTVIGNPIATHCITKTFQLKKNYDITN
jgi:hypothetical protein